MCRSCSTSFRWNASVSTADWIHWVSLTLQVLSHIMVYYMIWWKQETGLMECIWKRGSERKSVCVHACVCVCDHLGEWVRQVCVCVCVCVCEREREREREERMRRESQNDITFPFQPRESQKKPTSHTNVQSSLNAKQLSSNRQLLFLHNPMQKNCNSWMTFAQQSGVWHSKGEIFSGSMTKRSKKCSNSRRVAQKVTFLVGKRQKSGCNW